MSGPKISIVIPTCNRPTELTVCLRALWPQIPSNGTVEVLILDDDTNTATRELVENEFPKAQWRAGPRRGPAANRNLGAHLASGDWLVFLDDDCIPVPGWLAGFLSEIDLMGSVPACLAGATYRAGDPPSLLWEAPHNPDGRFLISCNMAIPKLLFAELNGFDIRYPLAAFEDTEFEARVRLLSIPIRFVPAARVDHPLRRVSSPQKCAARWEGKVIYALDQGASPMRILWGLPWHVLRVIQSRFRTCAWDAEDFRALFVFSKEWIFVIWQTPSWIAKWSRQPRSPFWTRQLEESGPVPKYGF